MFSALVQDPRELTYEEKVVHDSYKLTNRLPNAEVIALIERGFEVGVYPRSQWIDPARSRQLPPWNAAANEPLAPGEIADEIDPITQEEFMQKIQRFTTMVGGMDQFNRLAASIIQHRIFNPVCSGCGRAEPARNGDDAAETKAPLREPPLCRCKRCKITYYCGPPCQLAHRPAHKRRCKDPYVMEPDPTKHTQIDWFADEVSGKWGLRYKHGFPQDTFANAKRLHVVGQASPPQPPWRA